MLRLGARRLPQKPCWRRLPQLPNHSLNEVIETLSLLRDLPELLGAIEQADRAALYQALGLRVTYRRVGAVEQVRLRTSLRAVDLVRVGVRGPEENSLVPALRSVDLERVGGGT